MHIEQAQIHDAQAVASVLQEAAQWLVDGGRPMWSPAEFSVGSTFFDIEAGIFVVARDGGDIIGIMRFELDDPYFWPEIKAGTSAFVHKLAVRRAWAGKGVSTALLTFAQERTRGLNRPYLRLDCAADRQPLRAVYENFGFALHSIAHRGSRSFARYELAVAG